MTKLQRVRCPVCDGSELRGSRPRGFREFVLSFLGFHPFRCRTCQQRFLGRPVGLRSVRWAKCPKCLRLDLSTWDPKYYHPDWWMDFRCQFGANRWRCEACRRNFVSFRPRKEKYRRPGPGESAYAWGAKAAEEEGEE